MLNYSVYRLVMFSSNTTCKPAIKAPGDSLGDLDRKINNSLPIQTANPHLHSQSEQSLMH